MTSNEQHNNTGQIQRKNDRQNTSQVVLKYASRSIWAGHTAVCVKPGRREHTDDGRNVAEEDENVAN